MMFRTLTVVAVAVLVGTITAMGHRPADAAPAVLVNAGFETGDLTGWDSGGDGTITVAADAYGKEPIQGRFALLTANDCDPIALWQTFSANNGETISGWAFFKANDSLPDFNDYGKVVISEGDTVLFEKDVEDVGDFGSSPWTAWDYTFQSTGSFTLRAETNNVGDCAVGSALGFDVDVAGVTNTEVGLDIKPGPSRNRVNSKASTIKVALLGSADLDVTEIDTETVGFGPLGVPPSKVGRIRDVNRDGYLDLLLEFPAPGVRFQTSLEDGTVACVVVTMSGSDIFWACDSYVVGGRQAT